MNYKKFEITQKCNLKCEVCYNKNLMKRLKEISVENILKNVSPNDVVFIGGGEPMLHPNIKEISNKLINFPTEVVISTNGLIYKEIPKQIQMQILCLYLKDGKAKILP